MKYRTDFVTNSSSSSFIFQKTAALKNLKEEIADGLKSYDREKNGWWEDYYEDGIQMLEGIESSLVTAKDLDYDSIDEIFNWYYDEIVASILGVVTVEELEHNKAILERLATAAYTDEQLYKIFLIFVLDLIIDKYYYDMFDSWEERLKAPMTEELTYDNLDGVVSDYVSECMNREYCSVKIVVARIFMENYEKRLTFLKSLKASPVNLFQEIFDCSYVFYVGDCSSNPVFAEVVESIPSCIYWCNHMG